MNIIEKQQVRHYHATRLKKDGKDLVKAQGWTSKKVQQARFRAIASSFDFNNVSVLDVGCGVGDFYDYLDQRFKRFDYIGVDQQPEFIEYAKQRYDGWKHTWFHQADFSRCVLPEVDVVVVSGALSYRSNDQGYYMDMVRKLYASANRALIFNMLDSEFFKSSSLLVAHDREETYRQCREVCKNAELKTGYLDNDFTIVMIREKT